MSEYDMIYTSYSWCAIRVELRSWSGDCTLFTRLDKRSGFIHTSNCKSVLSPYFSRALTIAW